ncbi:MAG: sulfide/dihydroorotate dehydrogenase-like FAD/NAD-binding protein [Xanthomonadales bacterium]|jgi:NAD(P)H-flavin reductase|nr:sulfide/dihydroorotate dehydrogenase-like FAD/NAD-binding protein [Xanthomonadales bacterium]
MTTVEPRAPSRNAPGNETTPDGVPVVRREDFSSVTYLLEIHHPRMARAARPGQFVIVMPHENGERIPLTIADFDREAGTITLVIQAVGKTTRQMQRDCVLDSLLFSVTGPMGEPSRIHNAGKVVCVGGGLGVAPVFPQVRAYREAGAYVIGVIGFRSQSLVFWEDKFSEYCDELLICTDDGSRGIHGRVTAGIARAIEKHPDIAELLAIGPPVMMQACAEATRPHGIRTTVSLNPVMVDGTGMCGGCRVKLHSGMKFACVDGPEFDGHDVDFEDLVNRLNRFQRDERLAVKKWSESCKAPGA